MFKKSLLTLACVGLFSLSAQAEEAAQGFSGEGELGYTNTTGNSDTDSLNARLGLAYFTGPWEYGAEVSAVSARANGGLTNERYLFDAKAARTFAEVYYGFGNLHYDRDLFSGYEYRASTAMGVGRRFLGLTDKVFNIEVGAGYLVDKLETEKEQSHGMLHAAAKFRYPLNKQVSFAQDFMVQATDDNTHSESITGLKVSMTDNLALKLSYTLKHNSEVLPGRKNLDTMTAVTVVYGF